MKKYHPLLKIPAGVRHKNLIPPMPPNPEINFSINQAVQQGVMITPNQTGNSFLTWSASVITPDTYSEWTIKQNGVIIYKRIMGLFASPDLHIRLPYYPTNPDFPNPYLSLTEGVPIHCQITSIQSYISDSRINQTLTLKTNQPDV